MKVMHLNFMEKLAKNFIVNERVASWWFSKTWGLIKDRLRIVEILVKGTFNYWSRQWTFTIWPHEFTQNKTCRCQSKKVPSGHHQLWSLAAFCHQWLIRTAYSQPLPCCT